MSFTNHMENLILNWYFGNAASTPPGTLYVGLSTTTIAEDGTGVTEPTGNGYARVAVTNNTTNFPSTTIGEKSNGVQIDFPVATGPWGTITDYFIADAQTGGNIVGKAVLDVSRTINTDGSIYFPVGAMKISLD